jgi:hypothetical protein
MHYGSLILKQELMKNKIEQLKGLLTFVKH